MMSILPLPPSALNPRGDVHSQSRIVEFCCTTCNHNLHIKPHTDYSLTIHSPAIRPLSRRRLSSTTARGSWLVIFCHPTLQCMRTTSSRRAAPTTARTYRIVSRRARSERIYSLRPFSSDIRATAPAPMRSCAPLNVRRRLAHAAPHSSRRWAVGGAFCTRRVRASGKPAAVPPPPTLKRSQVTGRFTRDRAGRVTRCVWARLDRAVAARPHSKDLRRLLAAHGFSRSITASCSSTTRTARSYLAEVLASAASLASARGARSPHYASSAALTNPTRFGDRQPKCGPRTRPFPPPPFGSGLTGSCCNCYPGARTTRNCPT
ncbi:hypothetical protein FKP32DRAFT_437083 [Trametes sanguinea]|nr:hypothetical protein FKP32DRAFT_437083 [Trametes sanguinea]